MKQVVVVIPVYQQTLNENEQKSLARCREILGKHPIVFVAPDGLKPDYFNEIPNHQVMYFDPTYFQKIRHQP